MLTAICALNKKLIVLLGLLATAGPSFANLVDRQFSHILGGEGANDFVTRRPVQSALMRIKDLVAAVNSGKTSLDEINSKFVTGIILVPESDSTRGAIYQQVGQKQILWKVTPPPMQGKWVLLVKNNVVFAEIIEALVNNISLTDFLAANQISRLVIQPEESQFAWHFVVTQGYYRSRNENYEYLGLTILMESEFSEVIDHINLERMKFYPLVSGFRRQGLEHRLFKDFFEIFWFSIADPNIGFKSIRYRNRVKAIFESLGFNNPDKIIPTELQNPRYLLHYTFMLGAMGYRFNPGPSNTGHFVAFQNEAERKAYLALLAEITLTARSIADVSESTLERFVDYYERVAASFKFLEERNLLPRPRYEIERKFPYTYFEWYEIFNFNRHWFEEREGYVPKRNVAIFSHTNTAAFPFEFDTLRFMDDAVALAERLDQSAVVEYKKRGREKDWDFSVDQFACRRLFQVRRRSIR